MDGAILWRHISTFPFRRRSHSLVVHPAPVMQPCCQIRSRFARMYSLGQTGTSKLDRLAWRRRFPWRGWCLFSGRRREWQILLCSFIFRCEVRRAVQKQSRYSSSGVDKSLYTRLHKVAFGLVFFLTSREHKSALLHSGKFWWSSSLWTPSLIVHLLKTRSFNVADSRRTGIGH